MTKVEMLAAIRRHSYLEETLPRGQVDLKRVDLAMSASKERCVVSDELAPEVRAKIADLVVADLKRQAEEAADVLRRAGVQVN